LTVAILFAHFVIEDWHGPAPQNAEDQGDKPDNDDIARAFQVFGDRHLSDNVLADAEFRSCHFRGGGEKQGDKTNGDDVDNIEVNQGSSPF
jgi:hypothetical protein